VSTIDKAIKNTVIAATLMTQTACASSPVNTEAKTRAETGARTESTTQTMNTETTDNTPDKANKAKTNTTRLPISVFGFTAAPSELKFLVKSNNCSYARHFDLDIKPVTDNSKSHTYEVTLSRNTIDRCRAMPRLVEISKPLETPLPDNAIIKLTNSFTVNSHILQETP